jgi:hypothetical protein
MKTYKVIRSDHMEICVQALDPAQALAQAEKYSPDEMTILDIDWEVEEIQADTVLKKI